MIDSDPHSVHFIRQLLSSVVSSEGVIIPSCSVNHVSQQSDARMVHRWRIGKDSEEDGHRLLEEQCRNIPEVTDENY